MTRPINVANYNDESLVGTTIAGMWDEYNSYRTKAMEAWKEVDLYRFATDTKSLPGGQNFDHSMHTPITHMVDEKLGSILNATAFPHEDWLGWQAVEIDDVSESKRKRILAYLKKIHAQTKFTRVGKKGLDDLKAYGNNFFQTSFVNMTRTEGDKIIAGYVGPMTKRISPYNIVFDPTVADFEHTWKIVLDRVSVGEFSEMVRKDERFNSEAALAIKQRRIGSTNGSRSNDYFKDGQYIPAGFDSLTAYLKSGYVDLLWFYGSIYDEHTMEVIPNRCIVVADYDKVVCNYHKPNSRIRKGSWKERPDNLWAQSPLEPIIGLNYMINHRENAKNDAIDRMIYPDQLYVGEPEIIHDEVTQRREIWAPVGGDARDIAPDASTLSFNTETQLISQTVMEAVGLPSDILGFRSPGEKTAFEVQNLTEGAFRGFIDHVAQWEQDCLEKVIADQIEIAHENFTEVATVIVETVDGFKVPATVTQDDLKSSGTLVPMGARRFSRMLQQLAGIQSMSQLIPVIGTHVNSFNLAKAVEVLSGLDDFGLVKRFAAIHEQGESQKEMALVEQDTVNTLSKPTGMEMELMPEDEI